MTLFGSGSVPWLVRHELRLSWRGLRWSRWPLALRMALLALAQAGGLALAWTMIHRPAPARQVITLLSDLASSLSFVAVSSTLMVALGIFRRHDLAWLLSAPLRPRRLLLAVMAGIALRPPLAIMAAPVLAIVNGFILLGWFSAVAAYPALLAAAMVVVCVAVWIVVGLATSVRAAWVEPAARLAAFGFMVASLAVVEATHSVVRGTLVPQDGSGGAQHLPPGHPGGGGPGDLAARAMLGEPGPLALAIGLGAAATLLTAWALRRRFVAGALSSLGPSAAGRPDAGAAARFRPGARAALFWKELRLLRRSPHVAVDALLRLAILLPLYVLAPGDAGITPSRLVVFLVCGAGQLARVMVSATIANDGDGELARTAPVRARSVQGTKAAVAACGMAVFLLPACAVVAWQDARLLVPLLVGLVGCGGSAMVMTVRRPVVAARADLGGVGGRLSGSGWRILAVSLVWTIATSAAVSGWRFG